MESNKLENLVATGKFNEEKEDQQVNTWSPFCLAEPRQKHTS